MKNQLEDSGRGCFFSYIFAFRVSRHNHAQIYPWQKLSLACILKRRLRNRTANKNLQSKAFPIISSAYFIKEQLFCLNNLVKDSYAVSKRKIERWHNYASILLLAFLLLKPLGAEEPSSKLKNEAKNTVKARQFEDKSATKNKVENNKSDQKSSSEKTKTTEESSNSIDYGYKAPQAEDLPNPSWLIIKSVAVLSLFAGGFFLLFRVLSKKNRSVVLGNQLVEVIANVPIGQSRFLQIVDIGGSIYVLGSTDHNVSLITQIEDSETLNRIKVESGKILQGKNRNSFSELMQKVLQRDFSFLQGKDQEVDKKIVKETLSNSAESRSEAASELIAKHRQRLRELNRGSQ